MSILIRGMEMPLEKSRVIQIYPDGTVRRLDGSIYNSHFEAVPVPPHGDLIERKAAYDSLLDGMVMTGYQSRALDCISDFYVPTVIEAEEDE